MSNALMDAVIRDIKEITKPSNLKKVFREVGDLYFDSIEELNQKGQDPTGNDRIRLNQRYAQEKFERGLQAKPDFYYSGNASNSFDYTLNDKGVKFAYGDAEASNYMYDHEFAQNGMPLRRQLPVESDMDSAPQRANKEEVERLFNEHMNQPRTIYAKEKAIQNA